MNKLISICFWISLLVSAPTLAQTSPPASFIQLAYGLAEFYNNELDHYFYVDQVGEEYSAVKNGAAGANWVETGKIIMGVASYDSNNKNSLYRFYGSVSPGPNSHFFTLNEDEREHLIQLEAKTPATQKRWNYEPVKFGPASFARYVPSADVPSNKLRGCDVYDGPREFVRILRFYNDGFARGKDSNHRFVLESDVETIATMTANGWKNEGIAFCGRVPFIRTN
jgi:hypothetical protein